MPPSPKPPTAPQAPKNTQPPRATAGSSAEPSAQQLLVAIEDQLQGIPMARSRPVQHTAPSGVQVPQLEGRVLVLEAPLPVTEEEMLGRFAEAADPFFTERERATGEAVGEGDAVLLTWEARVEGDKQPFLREEQVEGRVLEDPDLPGFYENLVGQKVGGSVRFSSIMPRDFPQPRAQGALVDFTVQIHRARERTSPDTESPKFLEALGLGATLEEVMDALGRQAVEERNEELDEEAKVRVLDMLAEETEATVPAEWVELELREQWKGDQVLATANEEAMDPLDSWLADPRLRGEAELKLKLDLALQALCAQDGLRTSAEDTTRFLEALAEGLEVSVDSLRKVLASHPAYERLAAKATWFLRASEHALSLVEVQVPEDEEPGEQQ
jgi:trigger factor